MAFVEGVKSKILTCFEVHRYYTAFFTLLHGNTHCRLKCLGCDGERVNGL